MHRRLRQILFAGIFTTGIFQRREAGRLFMKTKTERILDIYDRLLAGKILVKKQEAYRFEVDERTIQRDFDDIRSHFAEGPDSGRELVYDRGVRGYVMKKEKMQ